MAKDSDDKMVFDGRVIDALPITMFMVEIEINGTKKQILTYLSGRMRKNYIRVLLGDRVQVEMSPYDLEKGRITFRYKN